MVSQKMRLCRPRVGGSSRSILKPLAILGLGIAVLCASASYSGAQTDDEGVDLMRLITSQWVKPNIMLVLDRSGSMAWPVSNGSTYIPFEYDSIAGQPHVNYDYTYQRASGPYYRGTTTFPNSGVGHGYWLKLDRRIDWSKMKWANVGSTVTGRIHDTRNYEIRLNWGHPFEQWDMVWIDDFDGHPEVDGLYQIVERGDNWIRVATVNEDGLHDINRYYFPENSENLDIQQVRIGVNNPADMEARGPALTGYYTSSRNGYLYIQGDPLWCRGDLIRVSGMASSSDNGIYLIKSTPQEHSSRPGFLRFRFARMASNGTWDFEDSNDAMTSNGSRTIQIQRVMPPSIPIQGGAVWYFVPPSRMAITKNVLGEHIWIYRVDSSVSAAGSDDRGTDYYTFGPGLGPDASGAAYYDWYYKMWVNWTDETYHPTGEPIPDAAMTNAMEPSDLVRQFGDVVNWGLVAYSGGCDNPAILVQANPDDGSQVASINAIEAYLEPVGDGGLNPGGSTPTRGALARAREGLLTGYDGNPSVWDMDSRRACDRTYGVILMTDGQSNQCNPNNGSWGGCPNNWDQYPAGRSDELWDGLDDNSDFLTHVRTWVIGVSQYVGRCELNYTAYRGRTDASSPNDDAGFATDEDPRLPEGAPGSYDDSDDYAYFANSAEELYSALVKIVTSMGAGGYATGAPSISEQSSAGSIAFLASTYYPTWEGHLRAFNLNFDPADPNYLRWDAAEVLTDPTEPNRNHPRKIYTWDPSSSNDVVEITSANHATIDGICGSCGFDAAVADFVLGNDGAGNPRDTLLGPIINSTPTVIGPPRPWDQGNVEAHSDFENDNAGRRSLVWIGTSDGMVRAFDVEDGAEILCIIPPDLLDNQAKLYNAFVAGGGDTPLGQPQLPSQHIYGVANSLRFTDVYFGGGEDEYKTVLFITEGPGGSGVHALDVTHPFPGRTVGATTIPEDNGYGFGNGTSGDPFEVLWSKTGDGEAGTDVVSGLGNTWSVPALGAVGFDEWRMQIGAGFNENTGNATEPRVYFMDPATGDPSPGNFANSSPEMSNSTLYWVSNQTFSDAVFWEDTAENFKQDNLVTEGVQADLNGHLWRLTKQGNSMNAEALVTATDPEPMYYSPAVASYPALARDYSIYAFSSGSYYEVHPSINGPDVGTSGNFIPKIYIAVRSQQSGNVQHVAIPIQNIPDPAGGTLGRRAQPTASPMLFTPKAGSNELPFLLYLIFDPDATECIGISYIVKVTFDPEDLGALSTNPGDAMDVYEAGEGTSGGFALAGEHVYVAQSVIGRDAEATLVIVPDLEIPIGAGNENVNWWLELQ